MKTKTQTLYSKLFSSKKTYDSLRFPLDIDVNGSKNILVININTVEGSRSESRPGVKVIEPEDNSDKPTYQQQGSGSVLSTTGSSTRRINTAICLYMPNNIKNSYGGDWSASELGVLGSALSTGKSLSEIADMPDATGFFNVDLKTKVGQSVVNTVSGIVQAISPVNAKDAQGIIQRQINNPYMEVMFNGVKNRSFSFTFKFIPRNVKEQEEIKKIIYALKYHSLPEIKSTGGSSYWVYPSEFDLSFLNQHGENEWLAKISTCALTDMDVVQGGDSYYSSFNDGSPFQTELTLSFLEMEVLTKQRIEEGF